MNDLGKIINCNQINQFYLSSGDLKGKDTPILFLHGLGSSSQDWEYQWEYFAPHFPLIAPDLRGHGQTDKPDMPYSVPLFSEDIASLIQAITNRPVHVVGLSLGGMVAFQLVTDHPELVKSLTIVNSGPAVVFPGIKKWLAFQSRKITIKLMGTAYLTTQIINMLFPKPEQAALRAKYQARWSKNDPKAYKNALEAFHHWDVQGKLKDIQCETLIVSADQDYTPVSLKAEYMENIPHARLVVIHDSHHLSPIDQPEQFNQVLQDFLRNLC